MVVEPARIMGQSGANIIVRRLLPKITPRGPIDWIGASGFTDLVPALLMSYNFHGWRAWIDPRTDPSLVAGTSPYLLLFHARSQR